MGMLRARVGVRTIRSAGDEWANVSDLKLALKDDDMILRAAAMLKTSRVTHHDSAVEALRRTIAYFFTEATGALAHTEN